MNILLLHSAHLLAQIVKQDPSVPVLDGEASSAMPLIIAAVMVGGIMLIGFKQSRRNHLDKAN